MARIVNAFGLVLLLVFATFVAVSLIAYDDWGAVAITLLGALSAAVALATARATRFLMAWGGRLAVLSVLCAAAGAVAGGRWFFAVSGLILVLLLAVSAAAVLRAVVTEDRVGFRTILGAVSVYLTLGLLFAFLYVAVERIQHQPFFGAGVHVGRGDFPFFSMTTLTTTGYGNLVPAAQPGKMFAVLEMLLGQVFLVTLIARLVSLWQPGRWLRQGAGLAQDTSDEPGA
ncbi:MAG TPA: potassium channel family protein [Thermoleophilaceae bacterium]|nr:potassium channel family protein [Thermoleophilaceae bacterium]